MLLTMLIDCCRLRRRCRYTASASPGTSLAMAAQGHREGRCAIRLSLGAAGAVNASGSALSVRARCAFFKSACHTVCRRAHTRCCLCSPNYIAFPRYERNLLGGGARLLPASPISKPWLAWWPASILQAPPSRRRREHASWLERSRLVGLGRVNRLKPGSAVTRIRAEQE